MASRPRLSARRVPAVAALSLAAAAIAWLSVNAPAEAQVNPFGRNIEMSREDMRRLGEAESRLYAQEPPAVGSTETWSNPKTGRSGTVTLIDSFERNGMPCRKLRHDINPRRHQPSYQFVIDRCRLPDGSWKID